MRVKPRWRGSWRQTFHLGTHGYIQLKNGSFVSWCRRNSVALVKNRRDKLLRIELPDPAQVTAVAGAAAEMPDASIPHRVTILPMPAWQGETSSLALFFHSFQNKEGQAGYHVYVTWPACYC